MSRVFYLSIVAALAGFIFGFDTVVISGVDKKLQSLWGSSDFYHGAVVMAMALWGTVLGALGGSFPTNKFGRKNTLLLIGILYTISALGSAFANSSEFFAFSRFIGGIGIGISTIAAPAYISEISPSSKRGSLVGLYQFNIVFGILIAFLSNYFLSNLGDNSWRWMMGVEFFPAIIYTILVFNIPKSPRWLIQKGKIELANKVLTEIFPNKNIEELINDISNEKADNSENIFQLKYRFSLLLTFFIAAFNQLSGINAFLYYAPRIFEKAGLGESTALLSSVGIGLVNLIFTFIGISLIDKLGRKQLMYYGSFGYIISLSLVSISFFLKLNPILIPIFLFVFIASHAIGQGTVIWVFISEIYPNHIRSSGQSFGSSVHWVLAAIIPSMIPILFSSIGPGFVFSFFSFMMFLQLIFVNYFMPETKGISLEELSKVLKKPSK
jgi:sugar porter (SP) family MFS transporter